MRIALVSVLVLATASGAALAGPTADKAKAHFAAIADADVAKITADYGDAAVFQWVGGALDGVYADPAAIKSVWGKFTTAQGKLEAEVKNIEEAVNPKGGTVTADVVFKGKAPIPVRYVLVYRDGKIVNEVWRINPASQ